MALALERVYPFDEFIREDTRCGRAATRPQSDPGDDSFGFPASSSGPPPPSGSAAPLHHCLGSNPHAGDARANTAEHFRDNSTLQEYWNYGKKKKNKKNKKKNKNKKKRKKNKNKKKRKKNKNKNKNKKNKKKNKNKKKRKKNKNKNKNKKNTRKKGNRKTRKGNRKTRKGNRKTRKGNRKTRKGMRVYEVRSMKSSSCRISSMKQTLTSCSWS
ncbi:hypothetical protein EYF80_059508 [Liparis tanakae]|uniref:Uncharacterized protein n=1 Tax=Liparis tanakae TaxID=230148 RepID=A0A4Z2EP28_9TELE|nr:hypothetical protein EYF80_059508 [Liparis tanakae]